MNVKIRLKFKKWLVIIIAWICVGIWQTIYDHFTLLSDISLGFSNNYEFWTRLSFNTMAGLVGALMGGAFLIFYVEEKFREKSYGFTLFLVGISFVIIVSFITLLLGVIFVPLISGQTLGSDAGRAAFRAFISDPVHVKNISLWALVVIFTEFFLQIDNKFGPGILFNFIKGTYRTPKREERIFMFVDLKSSTSIAEKLGNEKYHAFLKDFFRDITDPILMSGGQIYQYVGDEVVVSWPQHKTEINLQSLQCYFDMQTKIASAGSRYQEKYGIIPQFKAGMYHGRVTAGEIGVIKRDITYSGDVLNTAARIQSKCNEYAVTFLTSKSLIDLMSLPAQFKSHSLGFIPLRGKGEAIELCTVEKLNNIG